MRTTSAHIAPVLVLTAVTFGACLPEEDPPQNTKGCVDDWADPFLGALLAPQGNIGCVGDDPEGLDDACVEDVTLEGTSVDHQSSDPIGGVTVAIFRNSDASGSADSTEETEEGGELSVTVPVCEQISYRTTRGDDGKETIGPDKIMTPGSPAEYDFRSVSNSTAATINITFPDIELDDSKGIVFGKVLECGTDDGLANVQVLVRDADCKVPEPNADFGYTTNEIPDSLIFSTSVDGFFFAMNVPEGDWVLEGFVSDDNGETYKSIGSAPTRVEADAVTLTDIVVGRDDGLRIPDECTDCSN